MALRYQVPVAILVALLLFFGVAGSARAGFFDWLPFLQKEAPAEDSLGSGDSVADPVTSTVWGDITGTLSNQTDLNSALSGKAASTITIGTTYPLQGGGDLSGNRTLSMAFGTTTANDWSALQRFSAGIQASSTSLFATTTIYGTGDDILHIEGTNSQHAVHLTRTDSGGIHYSATNPATGQVNTDGTDFGIDVTGNAIIRQREALDIQFLTNGSEKLTIESNGNVGIGSTTPGTLLSLGDTGANTINLSATATSTYGSGINIRTGCFAVNGTCLSTGGGGITAIGPAGQTQTGATITIATSTSATNGITSALTITGSGDILTFTPSQSGTLTVAGGGTGAATLTGILKGNGTSAFSAASAGTDYVAPGAITTSGLTMATARILGRTTASTGALEELTIGTGLTLAAGDLSLNQGVSPTWTGAHDFGGATSLELPNGTGGTVDAIGEITLDTTDNQVVIATSTNASFPVVIPTRARIFGAVIASTSPDFVSGGRIPVPTMPDGYTMTSINCFVDGGTSVVFGISNFAGTADTETTTCDADGATTTPATNATAAAGAPMSLEIGTITGTVDYLTFLVSGYWTRE